MVKVKKLFAISVLKNKPTHCFWNELIKLIEIRFSKVQIQQIQRPDNRGKMNVSYFKNEANQKSEITHIGDNNGVSGEEESLEKKGVFLALDIYLIEQSLKKGIWILYCCFGNKNETKSTTK